MGTLIADERVREYMKWESRWCGEVSPGVVTVGNVIGLGVKVICSIKIEYCKGRSIIYFILVTVCIPVKL